MLVAAGIGLVVGILQAVTQVQEQTIAAAPKILGVFLVIMLLYYEADFKGLVLGVVFSGLAEFYWGLKLGALILPLLASAGMFFLLNRFFNIRSRILMIFSGVIMFIIFWATSVLVSKII